MAESLEIKLQGWPSVPEDDRPKPLYVSERVPDVVRLAMENKGWKLVDIRTMPNTTDADRADCLKAHLEGVRQGTVEASSAILSHLRLEAQVYGLIGGQGPSEGPSISDSDDTNVLLSFGREEVKIKELQQKRGPGRPKKVKL